MQAHHKSLIGRNYASPNLHKTLMCLVDYLKGRIYAKHKE